MNRLRKMRSSGLVVVMAVTLISVGAQLVAGQSGVVNSNQNGLQIALQYWYPANQIAQFGVGKNPAAVAFDGANIWVANFSANTVTKLRAADGSLVGTQGSFATVPTSNSPVTNDLGSLGTVTNTAQSLIAPKRLHRVCTPIVANHVEGRPRNLCAVAHPGALVPDFPALVIEPGAVLYLSCR